MHRQLPWQTTYDLSLRFTSKVGKGCSCNILEKSDTVQKAWFFWYIKSIPLLLWVLQWIGGILNKIVLRKPYIYQLEAVLSGWLSCTENLTQIICELTYIHCLSVKFLYIRLKCKWSTLIFWYHGVFRLVHTKCKVWD